MLILQNTNIDFIIVTENSLLFTVIKNLSNYTNHPTGDWDAGQAEYVTVA